MVKNYTSVNFFRICGANVELCEKLCLIFFWQQHRVQYKVLSRIYNVWIFFWAIIWCITWFLNSSCKKFVEKCQNFEILRKPSYSILRAETWQKLIFYHNKYMREISTKSKVRSENAYTFDVKLRWNYPLKECIFLKILNVWTLRFFLVHPMVTLTMIMMLSERADNFTSDMTFTAKGISIFNQIYCQFTSFKVIFKIKSRS